MIRKIKILGIIFSVCLFCIATTSYCTSAEDKGPTTDNPQVKAELKVGQVLVLRLEVESDPEYSWEIIEINELFLKKKGETIIKTPEKKDPSGEVKGMATLKFEGIDKGETTLQLGYIKPWEKGLPPMKLYTLPVVIK